jgi:hypothetical protein
LSRFCDREPGNGIDRCAVVRFATSVGFECWLVIVVLGVVLGYCTNIPLSSGLSYLMIFAIRCQGEGSKASAWVNAISLPLKDVG